MYLSQRKKSDQSIQTHCDAYAWGVAAALPYSTRITDLHAHIYIYYILITSATCTTQHQNQSLPSSPNMFLAGFGGCSWHKVPVQEECLRDQSLCSLVRGGMKADGLPW